MLVELKVVMLYVIHFLDAAVAAEAKSRWKGMVIRESGRDNFIAMMLVDESKKKRKKRRILEVK